MNLKEAVRKTAMGAQYESRSGFNCAIRRFRDYHVNAIVAHVGGLLDAAQLLMDGCSRHRDYRAKRKPTADCECCRKMWSARELLKVLS